MVQLFPCLVGLACGELTKEGCVYWITQNLKSYRAKYRAFQAVRAPK